MLITLQNIGVSFGEATILQNINLTLNARERVGVVGENGAGKTTFLRVLTGQLAPTAGEKRIGSHVETGYLEQNGGLGTGKNLYDEAKEAYRPVLDKIEELEGLQHAMAGGGNAGQLAKAGELAAFIEAKSGYAFEHEIKKVLSGMGFPPAVYTKPVAVLSGGERTRLALAKLLLSKPDILILDEPTNHLDFDTLNWLEEFLLAYKGAIVVVSHDRFFLDRVTTHIWEIEDTELAAYKGNYSAFAMQKAAALELQEKAYQADKEKVAKLEDYVARNLARASTSNMAKSRRKTLEKMQITEKPKTGHPQMKLRFDFDITPYEELVTVKNLDVKAGGQDLVSGLNLLLRRGQRLVVAGPNGAGKSTFLKVLSGKITPAAGRVRLGQGAVVSVFEQQQVRAVGRVIDALWNAYPRMTELEVRSHLALFCFYGEDVYKPVNALSGGELAKLRLAQMVLERANLIFMDEPTNHLDIYAREALTGGLCAYKGTLIVVTHDRYLMQVLSCPVLYLEAGGWKMYEDYNALLTRTAAVEMPVAGAALKNTGMAKNLKEQRRQKAERRLRLKELEAEVECLQADLQELENLLYVEEVTKDPSRMAELAVAISDKQFALDEAFNKWLAQSEEEENDEGED